MNQLLCAGMPARSGPRKACGDGGSKMTLADCVESESARKRRAIGRGRGVRGLLHNWGMTAGNRQSSQPCLVSSGPKTTCLTRYSILGMSLGITLIILKFVIVLEPLLNSKLILRIMDMTVGRIYGLGNPARTLSASKC